MGSFLANLALRTSMGESVMSGRSKCRSCETTLEAIDLIPLFSWFYLRGRCRHCGEKISPFYIIMEWLVLFVFIWCLMVVLSPGYLWAGCFLGWGLLTLSAIDLRCYRVPDFLTLPLIILGVVFNGITFPEQVIHFVIGAMVGYILFVLVAFLYKRMRGREGLGLGDAKLMAAAGAWVGWQGLPSVIMIAALLGIIVGVLWGWKNGRELSTTKIPFGPFLSFSIWIIWVYGPIVLN